MMCDFVGGGVSFNKGSEVLKGSSHSRVSSNYFQDVSSQMSLPLYLLSVIIAPNPLEHKPGLKLSCGMIIVFYPSNRKLIQ